MSKKATSEAIGTHFYSRRLSLEDPKGKTVERVREIREEVKVLVQELLRAEAWQ